MPLPSNSYADKIYSEHPLDIWPLDEEIPASIPDANVAANTKTNIQNVGAFYADSSTMAKSYGNGTVDAGYYVYPVADGKASRVVESSGIPMVFGGANLSEVYPNGSSPSIIIPGKGFLNENGKYKNYTVEFWLKSYVGYNASSTTQPFRFFGPVASTDGLYADNYFIILKIGDYQVSHFIGEWNRPMLIQIQTNKDGALLLVNGDVVGQVFYDVSTITFPSRINSSNSKEQDWLGFYSANHFRLNIDCVSISPNLLSNMVAKKRFLYGQAVEIPQSIISKNGGGSLNIDYSVANYTGNQNYPNPNSWTTGVYDNLEVRGSVLGLPSYTLPDFYIYKSEVKTNFSSTVIDNTLSSDKKELLFLKPTSDYRSFLKFNGIPLNKKQLALFYIDYAIYNKSDINTNTQSIIKFLDKQSGEYFEITSKKNGNVADIKATLSSAETPLLWSTTYDLDAPTKKRIAINIDNLETSFLNTDQSNIVIYVGGQEATTSAYTFGGQIYSIGFISENTMAINYGIAYDETFTALVTSATSSLLKPTYALIFKTLGSTVYPDIRVCGYWQDQIPFAKLAKTINGSQRFDFIQINNGIDKIWTDGSSSSNISPIGPIKMYASTQLGSDSNNNRWWLSGTTKPNKTMAVKSGIGDKLQVLDGTIIYPYYDYLSENFAKSYVSIAMEIDIDGILTHPIGLKTLQIAAQSAEPGKVLGARYDINMSPTSGQNPYVIYKGSSPHNYLTNNTGIKLAGYGLKDESNNPIFADGTRAIKINLNKKNNEFFVGTLQFVYNFNEIDKLLTSDIAILEIKNQQLSVNHIKIYLHKENDATTHSDVEYKLVAKKVATNGTETTIDLTQENPSLIFYIDGHKTTNPIVSYGEWATIGMLFPIPLQFNFNTSSTDGISIVGPGVFNNFVYFYIPKSKYDQENVYYKWSEIQERFSEVKQWNDYTRTWQEELLSIQNAIVTSTPDQVFELYSGLNKIIVDIADVDGVVKKDIQLMGGEFSIYKNTSWFAQVVKPV